MKKIKGPVEEPSQKKKGPREEAQSPPKETAGSGTAGGTEFPRDQGPGEDGTDGTGAPLPKQAPRPNRSCRSGAKSQEQDLVVVCHVRDGAGGKQPVRAPRSVLGTERMEYYRKVEQLSEDRWAFLARNRGVPLDFRGRYGMKDGTLGPGKLVKEKKKEKLAMGKKSKMAYMVRWCGGCVIESEANARIGRRWLG